MHDLSLTAAWIKSKIENSWCLKMLVPNSASTVAAAVPRSPELISALDHNSALEAKQKSLHAEISALSKNRNDLVAAPAIDAATLDARLVAIGNELRDLERRRIAASRKIEQHKAAYVAAVRASLLQRRHAAAARVVSSISEFEKAAVELQQTAEAIQKAGGSALQLPHIPLIGGLKKIAEKIATEP